MSTARVPDRHIAHLDNQVSFPISALGKQWLRGLKTFQLNRQAFKSSLASQSSTNHRYSGKEQPGEYSQLRRGGHLLEANARQRISLHVCQARRSDRRDREEGLPSSLYVRFDKLPPDGQSLLDAEASCNPEERRCTTPVHVWEKKCKACFGTGQVPSRSRRGHRSLYTCLACHGLGFVRRASTTEIPDLNNGAITVGRNSEVDDEGDT